MQTGYLGETGRTVCRLISAGKQGSDKTGQKIAIKLQGGGYVFAHRLGAYSQALGLDSFFNFAVSKSPA